MRDRLRGWLLEYQDRLATWLRVGFAVLWAAMIWVLSSRPSGDAPAHRVYSYATNAAHVVVFGVLAGLVLLSTKGAMTIRVRLAIATAVFYGAIDELHQGFVRGRVMDPWDVCSDGMGACLCSFLLWWLLTGDARPKRLLLPCLVLAAGSVHLAAS